MPKNMVNSHNVGPDPDPAKGPGTGLVSMGSNILCRDVHTGPIVSNCDSLVPCTDPRVGPVQCEQAIKRAIVFTVNFFAKKQCDT